MTQNLQKNNNLAQQYFYWLGFLMARTAHVTHGFSNWVLWALGHLKIPPRFTLYLSYFILSFAISSGLHLLAQSFKLIHTWNLFGSTIGINSLGLGAWIFNFLVAAFLILSMTPLGSAIYEKKAGADSSFDFIVIVWTILASIFLSCIFGVLFQR